MSTIHLRAITKSNYLDIIDLKVAGEQEGLVAPNVFTIAQMQFKQEKIALGIYHKETPVGLIAYDLDDYDIWRLMIDARYQGRGYGKQAIERVIEILTLHGKLLLIRTSAILGKHGPLMFYKKLGFEENGRIIRYAPDNTPEEVELIHKIQS